MRDVFKRIGGRAVIDSVVDRLYDYMLTDDRVKRFFTNVNMDKQRQHQKDFITYALDGSSKYEGKDLRSAHQHLVDHMGLSDAHFDATVEKPRDGHAYSINLDVCAGPTDQPLPSRGTISWRMAFLRDRCATLTITIFAFARVSGSWGTLLRATPR
jgi:hemoglobin